MTQCCQRLPRSCLHQSVVGPRIDTRRLPSWPVRDGRGHGSGVVADKYQKLLVHTTNPDHLAASTPSLTDIPPLQVVPPSFDVRGRRGLMNNRNLTSYTCRSLGAPDE
jgi:hypothetical protein